METIEEKIEKAREMYERLKRTKNNGHIEKNGQIMLEEGTIIHGTGFDESKLNSIAEKGLLGSNFSGMINPDSNEKFPNGVNFFRIPKTCTVGQYYDVYSMTKVNEQGIRQYTISSIKKNEISGREKSTLGRWKEYDFLPKSADSNSMAFIINPSQDIQKALERDPYKNEDKDMFANYEGYNEGFKNMKNRVANVVYGIPSTQISGILVSDKMMEKHPKNIEFLKSKFPDAYIVDINGKILYRGLEKQQPKNTKPEQSKSTTTQDPAIRRSVFNPKQVLRMSDVSQKNLHLGNSGEMHRYTTPDGSRYLVKPAEGKRTKTPEPFRAFIQRAAYDVQRIVDPKSAVECNIKLLEQDGKGTWASIQEEIEGTNFNDVQVSENTYGMQSKKLQQYGPQFLREFVTDYLLGNYDSHSGNFIVDKNGTLRGIDKEQSFRFINEAPEGIDITYEPNGHHHEPIYNQLFRKYKKGQIDLDLSQVNQYLDRVDAVSDEEYRKIFENYAKTRCTSKEEQEELLSKILARKNGARSNINKFFKGLQIDRVSQELKISPQACTNWCNYAEKCNIPIEETIKCIELAKKYSMSTESYKYSMGYAEKLGETPSRLMSKMYLAKAKYNMSEKDFIDKLLKQKGLTQKLGKETISTSTRDIDQTARAMETQQKEQQNQQNNDVQET